MKNILTTILIAALVTLGMNAILKPIGHTEQTQKETAYERVIRTGVLRCGYGMWPPTVLAKDANTGKLSGLMYDITEEMAKNLNLKVEWAEETGWGSWPEGLNSGRFDAFCSSAYQTGPRGRVSRFTTPVFFNAVHAYARINDTRFDDGLDMLDDSQYKIAGMDGEISAQIPPRFFPKATMVSFPQLAGFDQLMLNVATGKADIVFSEQSVVDDFLKKNPNTLKRVTKKPFQVFASSFAVGIHEDDLAQMIDSALLEMQNSGVIEKIMRKHNASPESFSLPAPPYTSP